jgi:hypothetical protein
VRGEELEETEEAIESRRESSNGGGGRTVEELEEGEKES